MPVKVNDIPNQRMWECKFCLQWFEGKVYTLRDYKPCCKKCDDRFKFHEEYEQEEGEDGN